MLYIMNKPYVYVVLQYNSEDDAPVLHGIYTHREYADKKALKLWLRNSHSGYIAVLKKPIQGAGIRPIKEFGQLRKS